MIKVILVLMPLLLVLDFVPLKFAIKVEDAKKNLKDGYYICETNLVKPDVGWYASMRWNPHIDDGLCVKAIGNTPNSILSEKEFDFKWYELYNKFLLNGKGKLYEERRTNIYSADLELDVNIWDIIYPIKRASFRQYYAPKSYLTVYDYDWCKIIESIWK